MTRRAGRARRSGNGRRAGGSPRARLLAWLRPRPIASARRLVDGLLARGSRRSKRRPAIALIGLDVSRPPLRFQTHSWIPTAAALIVGGLFLAVLRMDVTRMRIDLGDAFKEELRLEEAERQLTVEMRRLRDPAVLTRRAAERGFRRADQLIDLEGPSPAVSPPAPSRRSIALASRRNDPTHILGTRP